METCWSTTPCGCWTRLEPVSRIQTYRMAHNAWLACWLNLGSILGLDVGPDVGLDLNLFWLIWPQFRPGLGQKSVEAWSSDWTNQCVSILIHHSPWVEKNSIPMSCSAGRPEACQHIFADSSSLSKYFLDWLPKPLHQVLPLTCIAPCLLNLLYNC